MVCELIESAPGLIAAGGETSVEFTLVQFIATLVLSAYAYVVFKIKGEVLKELKHRLVAEVSHEELKRQMGNLKLKGKILCFLAILPPTLYFVLVMRDTYVPAVFTMALLAIVVAVDHDTELEETPEEIAEGVSTLIERRLGVLEERFSEQTRKSAKELEKKVEILMQLSESETWAGALSGATDFRRVRCVVKHWEVPEEILTSSRKPEGYKFTFESNGTKEEGELKINFIRMSDPVYAAFRNTLEICYKDERSGRKKYLRFISPAPLRVQRMTEEDALLSKERAEINGIDTRYFFGLVYTMCCLYQAHQDFVEMEVAGMHEGNEKEAKRLELRQLRAARIRVGKCSNWVHVIDDKVYQMIETSVPSRSISRALHDEIERFGDTEERRKDRIKEWSDGYAEIVQNSYDRGSRAERYIASVLLANEGEEMCSRASVQEADTEIAESLGLQDDCSAFQFPSSGIPFDDPLEPRFLVITRLMARLLGGSDHEFKNQLLLDLINTRSQDDVQVVSNKIDLKTISGEEQLGLMIAHYLLLRLTFLDRPAPSTWQELKDFLIEESVL